MKARFVLESINFKRNISSKDSLNLGYSGLETFQKMARKHDYKLSDYVNPLFKKNIEDNEMSKSDFKPIILETWEHEIDDYEQIFIDVIYEKNQGDSEIILWVDLPTTEKAYKIKASFHDRWWDSIEEYGNKI